MAFPQSRLSDVPARVSVFTSSRTTHRGGRWLSLTHAQTLSWVDPRLNSPALTNRIEQPVLAFLLFAPKTGHRSTNSHATKRRPY